ncbi:MAG: SDR family NAD(P)-dependent oxidoreductase [Cryobacterium sp.]|nr:SDR family NAD(P)-dependent oxidoreductase [Oligoflexia bacterium]
MNIVITGASDGIGKGMALAFARRGARLGLIARRGELLEALAIELRTVGSPEVLTAAVDVTDYSATRAALSAFDETFGGEPGGISHLVLNAGISGRAAPWEDSWPEIKRCFDVNVLAALNSAEWMKAKMVGRRRGTIAGISSVAATRGLPDSGAYSASKAAITTYLESLRVDLAAYGVKVVTVAPGYIRTALTAKNRGTMPFLMDADRAGEIFAEGILAGKPFVVAPWPYVWIIRLLRILPRSVYDFAIRRSVKSVRGETPEQRRARGA